jgi:hypothetical protein
LAVLRKQTFSIDAGVLASLRLVFAFLSVDERYGDFTIVIGTGQLQRDERHSLKKLRQSKKSQTLLLLPTMATQGQLRLDIATAKASRPATS